MEKMLERTIVFAYRKALTLGVGEIKAREAALGVLYDACPGLEECVAKATLSAALSVLDLNCGASVYPRSRKVEQYAAVRLS